MTFIKTAYKWNTPNDSMNRQECFHLSRSRAEPTEINRDRERLQFDLGDYHLKADVPLVRHSLVITNR